MNTVIEENLGSGTPKTPKFGNSRGSNGQEPWV